MPPRRAGSGYLWRSYFRLIGRARSRFIRALHGNIDIASMINDEKMKNSTQLRERIEISRTYGEPGNSNFPRIEEIFFLRSFSRFILKRRERDARRIDDECQDTRQRHREESSRRGWPMPTTKARRRATLGRCAGRSYTWARARCESSRCEMHATLHIERTERRVLRHRNNVRPRPRSDLRLSTRCIDRKPPPRPYRGRAHLSSLDVSILSDGIQRHRRHRESRASSSPPRNDHLLLLDAIPSLLIINIPSG